MSSEDVPVRGRVTIEWPNAERCAPGPLQAWRTVVRDAESGLPLPVPLSVTVTAAGGQHVTADIRHFTGEDGEVLDGPGSPDPSTAATAVFRYEVMSMTTGPGPEFWTEFGDGTVRRDETFPVTGVPRR